MKIIVIMMQSHVIYAVILKKNRIYSAGYKSKKNKQEELSITQKFGHVCGSTMQFPSSTQTSSSISMHMEIYERWQL